MLIKQQIDENGKVAEESIGPANRYRLTSFAGFKFKKNDMTKYIRKYDADTNMVSGVCNKRLKNIFDIFLFLE